MKIYMVRASWYDDVHKASRCDNIAVFTSKKSAQKYIRTFPEVNEAAGRRVQELMDIRGYKPGQTIDSNDKELIDAFNEYICFNGVSYNDVYFWIKEYELKD